jgi:hypothetical protein
MIKLKMVFTAEGGNQMAEKMKGVTLTADWAPKPDFVFGTEGCGSSQTYLGSKVWKNPG